jgi:hypothetical protein
VNRLIAAAAFFVSVSLSVEAADWYDNVAASMGNIEEWPDGSIWLSVPLSSNGAPVTIVGSSNSCNVTQIHLIPPAGKEKEWLSMVLSASAAGKRMRAYGDCVPGNYRLDASRFVIEL